MTDEHSSVRLVGYARVSTERQDFAYQLKRLEEAGCHCIYMEKRSGQNTEDRPELAKLLASLGVGDVLLATVSDRLARDPLDMVHILYRVKEAGARLRLLDEPLIDTVSEMADVVAYLMGWAGRLQRQRILENTAHGRELARQRGVKFGRPPKLSRGQCEEILARRRSGETMEQLGQAFAVSRSTIIRLMRRSPTV